MPTFTMPTFTMRMLRQRRETIAIVALIATLLAVETAVTPSPTPREPATEQEVTGGGRRMLHSAT